MPPRPRRVEPHDAEPFGSEDGLGRLPAALELGPRACQACRDPVREVVVPGNRENGRAEAPQEGGGVLVLVPAAPMREVPGRDDQLRVEPRDEVPERRLDRVLVACADVQVGEVDQADGHDRGTLYTHRMHEPTELFDDLYLGLRAGGAIRKRRRGETLTTEEEAALTRWQRLSQWRKTIAIGAFAVGTFGLGFTLGGIVFSRRRKQEAA